MTHLNKIFDPSLNIYNDIEDIPTPSEDLALHMAKASSRTLVAVSNRAYTKDKTLYLQLQLELYKRRQPVLKKLRRS